MGEHRLDPRLNFVQRLEQLHVHPPTPHHTHTKCNSDNIHTCISR